MIFKIAGSVMVFCSCSLIGIYYSLKDGYRIADLNEIKKAVTILKSEIEYAMNPLPEALENISLRTSNDISRFFGLLAEKITNRNGEDIYTLWNTTLEETLNGTYLEKADYENIGQLGRTLGYLDKNLQLNSIDLLIEYIDVTTEQLQIIAVKNKRMYRSMGMITGLIVSIILL